MGRYAQFDLELFFSCRTKKGGNVGPNLWFLGVFFEKIHAFRRGFINLEKEEIFSDLQHLRQEEIFLVRKNI